MPSLVVYNTKGERVREIEVSDLVFGSEINESLMHAAVVRYLAGQRRGTAKTKTRAEVRGGGRKPWRQKGTGRARHGSIRSPIWTGGGVVFGPTPRDYTKKMNKKARRRALYSALSAKAQAGQIVVVDEFAFTEPKTKRMVEVLNNLKVDGKALIVTAESDLNVVKSARNLPHVNTTIAPTLNVYDILNCEKLVMTEAAVRKVEEVFA